MRDENIKLYNGLMRNPSMQKQPINTIRPINVLFFLSIFMTLEHEINAINKEKKKTKSNKSINDMPEKSINKA